MRFNLDHWCRSTIGKGFAKRNDSEGCDVDLTKECFSRQRGVGIRTALGSGTGYEGNADEKKSHMPCVDERPFNA